MFETLKGRIPKSIDEDEYRKFAVMVALLKQEDGLHVVFEKRAGGLKRQPGRGMEMNHQKIMPSVRRWKNWRYPENRFI